MEIQRDDSSRRATTKNPSKLKCFTLQSHHRVGNGEIKNEPIRIIAAGDPVSCTIYGRDNNLLDQPG